MLQMATTPAPRLRSVAPHVSPEVAAIVDCALEFRREDRYADARTMQMDVEQALATVQARGSQPVIAPPSAPAVELTVRAVPVARNVAGSLPGSRSSQGDSAGIATGVRRRSRLLYVTALLCAVLFAVAIVAARDARTTKSTLASATRVDWAPRVETPVLTREAVPAPVASRRVAGPPAKASVPIRVAPKAAGGQRVRKPRKKR
jgi:hypothetical protein